MIQENITKNELLVLPLQEAEKWTRQIAPVLDVKHTDLMAVFRCIQNTSGNFLKDPKSHSNNAIVKHCGLDPGSAKKWLLEMSGLGTMNKKPLIAALPCLYLIENSGSSPELICSPVYVRPPAQESSSLENYRDKLNENNLRVLTQWNAKRSSEPKQKMSDMLIKCANEGKTISSLVQKQITEIFSKYMQGSNITLEKQRFVYHKFVRPVLRKGIQQGILGFYQISLQGKALQALYWNHQQEIDFWYEVILKAYEQHVASDLPISDASEPEEYLTQLANYPKESLNDFQISIIEEFYMICYFLSHNISKETVSLIDDMGATSEEESVLEQGGTDISQLLDILAQFPLAVAGERLKVGPADLKKLEKNGNVLHTQYPVHGQKKNFYLSIERIPAAVLSAKRRLEKNGDSSQILLLSIMGVRDFLRREQIDIFTELENTAFFQKLPWYERTLRTVMGKKKLYPQELKYFREKYKKQNEEIIRQMRKKLSDSRRSLDNALTQRMENKTKALKNSQPNATGVGKVIIEDKAKIKLYLQKIVDVLDEAWRNKEYPNRVYLLRKMPEFGNEDNMIYFLKKNGGGAIYSFFIKVDKPDFTWPILVSRRYIRRDGKKILAEVRRQMDEQRRALQIPNQEKYDVLVHMESFLERTLAKLDS